MQRNCSDSGGLSPRDLPWLLNDLHDCRSKWFNIGIQLGVSEGDLNAIKQENEGTGDRLREMLSAWLRRVDPQPTRKALAAALMRENVGEPLLASKLYSDATSTKQLSGSSQKMSCCLSVLLRLAFVMCVMCTIMALSVFLYKTQDFDHSSIQIPPVPYKSRSLPIPSSSFIGREDDIGNITKKLDFDHSSTKILSMYGPPAIGKSTLAIHIGHKLAMVGIHVHYVNMAEIPDVQALCVRIFSSAGNTYTTSKISESDARNHLRDWTQKLESNTLLILDNCDLQLSDPVRKDPFQDIIEDLPRYSTAIKLLTTSQNTTALSLDSFELHRLTYLSRKDSFKLFRNLTNISNLTQVALVCDLVGGVPLALKITATLLKQKHSTCGIECIISKLKSKPLNLLSTEELSTKNTVQASINLAYEPLQVQYKRCGQYLAIFRGSFTEAAAEFILPKELSEKEQCLEILVKCSLLEWYHPYNESVRRYLFHGLIKNFLKAQQMETEEEMLKLSARYVLYYADFLNNTVIHGYNTYDFYLEMHNILLFKSILSNYSAEEIPLDVAIKTALSIEKHPSLCDIQLLALLFSARYTYGFQLEMPNILHFSAEEIPLDVAIKTSLCDVKLLSLLLESVDVRALPKDKAHEVLSVYEILLPQIPQETIRRDPKSPACVLNVQSSVFLLSFNHYRSRLISLPNSSGELLIMEERIEKVEQLCHHAKVEHPICDTSHFDMALLYYCRCNYVHYTCRKMWKYWTRNTALYLSSFCVNCEELPKGELDSLCEGCTGNSETGLMIYLYSYTQQAISYLEGAISYLEQARKETLRNDCQARKIVVIMALYSIYTSLKQTDKAAAVSLDLPRKFGSDIACYSSVYKYFIIQFYAQLGRVEEVQSLKDVLLDDHLLCKEKDYIKIPNRRNCSRYQRHCYDFPPEKDWECLKHQLEYSNPICSPRQQLKTLASEPLLCGILRSDYYTELYVDESTASMIFATESQYVCD